MKAIQVMKAIQIILGAGVVVALIGLNVAFADVISERTPIEFGRDVGGSVEMPPVSFDFMGGVGEEEVQGGCMMTPGGQESVGTLALLPPVIVPTANHSYDTVLAPLNSFDSPARPPVRIPGDSSRRPPDPQEGNSSQVPAPATLVIVGIGLAGIAVMRRRQVKPVAVE